MGSTLVARRAGITLATNPVSASVTTTTVKIVGSHGSTLNSIIAIARESASASTNPRARPTAIWVAPSFRIRSNTFFAPAPRRSY